jgi:hypothetical protein
LELAENPRTKVITGGLSQPYGATRVACASHVLSYG